MTRYSPRPLPCLLAILLAGGCSRPGGPGAGGATAGRTTDAAWDWSRFPESDTLLVGEFPGLVTAARLEAIRAPAGGRLHLTAAAGSGGRLEAGKAWGSIETDDSADERRDLDDQAATVADLEARYRRDGLPAELERLEREISGAKETLALARLAERSPELFSGDTPALDPTLKPDITAARAEEKLDGLVDRRRRVAAGDPTEDPPELRTARAGLAHARQALGEHQARASLTAPFAGTLRLARDDGAHVDAGELIATIEDDSELEIRIRGELPLLHAVIPASLTCTLAAPGGNEATARFAAVGVEMDGAQPVPVFRFHLPGSAWAGPGSGLSGTELPVLVFTRLPARGRIVPKLELARRDTGGVLAAGWVRGLSDLFPGCRVLAEGRADVAVAPPGWAAPDGAPPGGTDPR